VTCLVFAPDGRVVSASAGRVAYMWDLARGKPGALTPSHPLQGHTGSIRALAFAPAGDVLATGSEDDQTLRFWDVQTGQQWSSRALENGRGTGVAFSPDCATLALWSSPSPNGLQLVNRYTNQDFPVRRPEMVGVKRMSFSPDSMTLVAVGMSGSGYV